jgi:CubicO group peptidase (beta-lactamase class C family)
MKLKSLLLITLLLFNLQSIAQGQKTVTYEFENMLHKWQQEHKVPVVGIGIIEDGKVAYVKSFGEHRKGVPASAETIFTVASLTKPIFALTMLKLIDRGELTLDEPLYPHHLDPDLKVDNNLKKLNARYVLSHQSGFVNWRNMSPTKKLTFNFEPGSQYLYSGEGYEYLRKAIENKTRRTLPELAKDILFEPLELADIAFTWNTNWNMDNVAYPYNKNLEEYDYAPRTELNAAAGLQTTIKDYTEVCAYVLNGGGLSKSLFNDMILPQVQVKENLFYGLGWEIIPLLSNNESVLMHSGDENGIKTMVVLLPKSKKGIVVFTNGDDGFKVYQKVIESYLEEGKEIFEIKSKKVIPIENYKIPAEALQNYTGTFQIKENVTFEIVESNGKLNLLIRGQSPFKLVAQTKTIFQVDEEIKVEFINNEMEQPTAVIIYQYGVKSYEGKRIKK